MMSGMRCCTKSKPLAPWCTWQQPLPACAAQANPGRSSAQLQQRETQPRRQEEYRYGEYHSRAPVGEQQADDGFAAIRPRPPAPSRGSGTRDTPSNAKQLPEHQLCVSCPSSLRMLLPGSAFIHPAASAAYTASWVGQPHPVRLISD